jgi:hypothetical protein
MKEVSDQRSAFRNQRAGINRRDGECAEERVFHQEIFRTLRTPCLCSEMTLAALVAASPRWVSVVNTPSRETQKPSMLD